MTAPNYVWITHSWYHSDWWKENPMNRNCSHEIMREVINNSLAVVPDDFLLQKRSEPTISGLVR